MDANPVGAAASLRAFMAHLIDYAGLFPPAKLPLPDAIENYARYRDEPDRWMLSRFIIPASQLEELSTVAAGKFRPSDPFIFSALGRGGRDGDEFLDGFRADLKVISTFRQEHGAAALIDVYEVRLPASVLSNAQVLQGMLTVVAKQLSGEQATFYEAPFDANWEQNMVALVNAIAKHNATRSADGLAGFKLRCGGVEAAAFPSPAQVALTLAACRDAGVPLKATAGLHHPFRLYDASVQTKMHGFINVFGAGVLAHVHRLRLPDIQAIVEDENPTHFSFTDTDFAWQQWRASVYQIDNIRKQALISYGSCSFDEPREDLAALGLLRRSGYSGGG